MDNERKKTFLKNAKYHIKQAILMETWQRNTTQHTKQHKQTNKTIEPLQLQKSLFKFHPT